MAKYRIPMREGLLLCSCLGILDFVIEPTVTDEQVLDASESVIVKNRRKIKSRLPLT